MVCGHPRGYYQDQIKTVLVVSERNFYRDQTFFWEKGLKIVTGIQYLVGYIGAPVAHST